MENDTKQAIEQGRAALGIEFGSTRIKAVLLGEGFEPAATGSHTWENRLENGVWTYSEDDIVKGLQACYADLKRDVKQKFGVTLTRLGAVGISAMMHGYLPFDENWKLLVPFRTWRNTMTAQAADELTGLLGFNIPQRWSVAHLYQAVLNREEHVPCIRHISTLAGYAHMLLTGQNVLGVGDASGVFPLDSETSDYHQGMLDKLNERLRSHGFTIDARELFPHALQAGENAGALTAEGARLLDPTGDLQAGAPFCPPEGDAGTGMTATNSVAPRTGNVSAGTSVFVMAVLEKPLSRVHPEIDMVTTPTGKDVAMVHCNNCTSDLNAWAGLIRQAMEAMGQSVDTNELYTTLFNAALKADPDCSGLMSFNYDSGEPVTGFESGCPIFVREPGTALTLEGFMRTLLTSSIASLKLGMDILRTQEQVRIDKLCGHGGFFKTKGVGQRLMAAAMNAPVAVMETAGEGGAWGMALLAAYMQRREDGESLEDYLTNRVFAGNVGDCVDADASDVAGFDRFVERYRRYMPVERAAAETCEG